MLHRQVASCGITLLTCDEVLIATNSKLNSLRILFSAIFVSFSLIMLLAKASTGFMALCG